MPYEKGGRADKKGNKYEINCIVYELLKVLDGSNYSVVIEALGEDEKGTDILVTNHEGKKEHQQCKARNGSSDNWTISDLKARKIFNAWKIQLDRECDRKVALVSPMTCSFLVDLNDRANNTSGKADEFYDFQIMNSSKEFQSFYENFCKEMNIEIGRESGILKSIDYLKRIYYKQISEYEIQELITQNIQYQFSSPKDMVYDAFVSMIVSKDILGRELTQIALIDYIEKKNIKFQLREDDGRIGFRIKELNQEYRESFRTLQEGLIHRKEFDNCIKYPVDVVKNLLDHGNKKRISVAAKLEYTDNIKKVTFDNCCYEYDLWDEKGFNIAIDYDEIVGFISLWEYLKRELDVFETEKEVSKSEIELFFRKYEKMTNMSNKTSNYIPIVEEETLRMIDDKLQRKVGD